MSSNLTDLLKTEGWKVIASKINLTKKGDKFLGLCPFHNEKTPSLNVTEGGIYFCFGCKSKGNALSFLTNYLGFSKQESLKYVSQLLNTDFKFDGASEKRNTTVLSEINILAAQFYSRQLLDKYREYLEYLIKRGYHENYIRKYKIGFAPKNNALLKWIKNQSQDINDEVLLESNLIKLQQDKSYNDFFQERIIWPIYNHQNEIVGFSGRIIDDNTTAPKYLNIGNNILYQKHSVLYGIDRARKMMLEKQCLIIVEGYTDADILQINNIKNVVATCGTALCKEHILNLISINNGKILPLVVIFDGDAAGRKGVYKVYEVFKGLKWFDILSHIDVLILEGGLDPCEFMLKYGEKSFEKLIKEKTIPITSFIIEDLANTNIYSSPIIRRRIVINQVKLFLEELPSYILLNDFFHEFISSFPSLKDQIIDIYEVIKDQFHKEALLLEKKNSDCSGSH